MIFSSRRERELATALFLLSGLFASCSDDSGSPPPSGPDGRSGTAGLSGSGGSAGRSGTGGAGPQGGGGGAGPEDASIDAPDASFDSPATDADAAPNDASTDTGASTEAGPDAVSDAGPDAFSDAQPDEAARCAARYPAPTPGGTLQGSLTIENQSDIDDLNRYSELTGDLTVSNGLVRVVLPNLVRVGGAINVRNTGSLVELALPSLSVVGGHVTLDANSALEDLALCALRQVVGITITENDALGSVEFPSLEIAPYFGFGGNPLLSSISAPKLVTAPIEINGSPLMTRYDLPALRTVRWIAIESMPALATLGIPAVTSMEGAGIRIEGTGLTGLEWNGSSSLADVVIGSNTALNHVKFPNVRGARDLQVSALSVIDFRSITTAGSVQVGGLAHQLWLSALVTAENLRITTTAAGVFLDKLQSVRRSFILTTHSGHLALPELVSSENFHVQFNPYATFLSAPKLRTVTNSFFIAYNQSLPSCYALAILAQLTTVPPSVTTSNNNGVTPCR
jgi:hypothetical protein